MKTLLAVGCSFTFKDYKSSVYPDIDCSWPKWPEIVGKKLGYEVVNLGTNGHSNDNIMRSAQDYLAFNKADMVCALWTEPFRLNLHDTYHANWYSYLSQDAALIMGRVNNQKWRDPSKSLINYKELAKRLCQIDEHARIANEQLRYMHSLDIIGKYYNIPVYHMQGVSLWHTHVYKTASEACGYNLSQEERHIKFKLWLRSYMNSPYFDILDKQDNIWGWPFYKELGGDIPIGHAIWPNDNRIGKCDFHPNAYGHEILADKYYELIHK